MVLTQESGRPWAKSGNGLRSAWIDTSKAAGIAGLSFHDLRGTFATRRMADGWTARRTSPRPGGRTASSPRSMLGVYVDRKFVAERRAEALGRDLPRAN